MKTIYTTDVFDAWFGALRDRIAQKRIQARIRRAELGNLGDCEPVGEGVSEMRIHYGPGYRVYFTKLGIEIIVLLAGVISLPKSKTSRPRSIWRVNCKGLLCPN